MELENLLPRFPHHVEFPYSESDQFSPQPPVLVIEGILSSHLFLGLPDRLFPSGFPVKAYMLCCSTHTCYMPQPSHLPLWFTLIIFSGGSRSWSSLACNIFFSVSSYFVPPSSKYFLQRTVCRTFPAYLLPSVWETMFHTHVKQKTQLFALHDYLYSLVINSLKVSGKYMVYVRVPVTSTKYAFSHTI